MHENSIYNCPPIDLKQQTKFKKNYYAKANTQYANLKINYYLHGEKSLIEYLNFELFNWNQIHTHTTTTTNYNNNHITTK